MTALCNDADFLARNFHEMRTYIKEYFDYERLAIRLRMLIELQSLKRRPS